MSTRKELNHCFLGSNEGDRGFYCGWEIPTYTGKVHQDLIIKRLKHNLAEWTFHTEYENYYFQNDFGEKVH